MINKEAFPKPTGMVPIKNLFTCANKKELAGVAPIMVNNNWERIKIPILAMVYNATFIIFFSFNKIIGRKINKAKFFMVMEIAINKVNFFKSPLI